MGVGVHTAVKHKVLTLQVSSFLLRRQTAGRSDPACVDSCTKPVGRGYLSILAPASHTGDFSSVWNRDGVLCLEVIKGSLGIMILLV